MDNFDLKLKFALNERELELLKVQVSDIVKEWKETSQIATETKHALSHLTIALQTYKDLMAEKLIQQGAFNADIKTKQLEVQVQLNDLSSSHKILVARLESIANRLEEVEHLKVTSTTTTTTIRLPTPGSKSLDFSEGGTGLLVLRIILGIILGIATLLSGDAGLDVILGLFSKIFGGGS